MILIAHRGNISGPQPEKENHPDYISNAISYGYDVEIDIWRKNNRWVLGHDGPQYEVDESYLAAFSRDGFLWMHVKNIEALQRLSNNQEFSQYEYWTYFWHQEDDFAITSNGYIWTYPGKKITNRSICVMPERSGQIIPSICAGICSDFIQRYKK